MANRTTLSLEKLQVEVSRGKVIRKKNFSWGGQHLENSNVYRRPKGDANGKLDTCLFYNIVRKISHLISCHKAGR